MFCFVFCFVFLSDVWGFVFFGDIWVLRDSSFSAKEKKNTSSKACQWHIKHVCKISGSNAQKRLRNLDFRVVKCKNHALASLLLGFSIYSILGVKFDLLLVLRNQFFECLGETLYKNALEYLEATGPENILVIFFSSYTIQTRDVFFFFVPTLDACLYLASLKVL